MIEFLAQSDRNKLYELIGDSFSLDELRELSYFLGIDDEELPQATKGELIRELITYCERRGRLRDLLQRCVDLRPQVAWPNVAAVQPQENFPIYYQEPGIVNRPPQLFGRQMLLDQIGAFVTGGQQVLLHGMIGSGKTALATTIADDYLQQGRGGVIWFTVGALAADPLFDALAQRLGTLPEQQEIQHVSNEADQKAVQAILKRYRPALLVLDNAGNGAALRAMLQAVPPGMPVLVTSQLVFTLPKLVLVEVGDLAPQDALALLSFHAGRDYSQDKLAQKLCQVLAYHPYTLEIGGAIVKADGRVRQQRLQLIAKAPSVVATPFQDRPAIAALLEQSFHSLTPSAQAVFRLVGGLFTPSATPELLAFYLEEEVDNVWQALDELVYCSLARRQRVDWLPAGTVEVESYIFHDLTYSFANLLFQKPGKEHADLAVVVRRYVEQYAEELGRLRAEIANILAATKLAQRQADSESLVAIVGALALNGYMDSYGHSLEFLELLDAAIGAVRQRGAEDRELLHYLVGKLGNANLDRGKLAEARKAYKEALKLAPNPRRRIMALAVLGKVCYQEQAYWVGDAYFACGHQVVKANKNDQVGLGFLLQQQSVAKGIQGDDEAARAFASQAVEVNEQFRDQNPIRLLYSLLNLGTAEFKLGNPKAIEIHQQGYTIALEKGHTRLAADMLYSLAQEYHTLGETEQVRDRLVEARKLYQEIGDVAYEREVAQFMEKLGYQ
jgi:tetratricopeptide (TPR) repeat protein